jgi:hypothetical protein
MRSVSEGIVMKKYRATYPAVVLIGVLIFASEALPQDPADVVLVNGDPPLTQLMVGKTIVLMDWVLGLDVDRAREMEIRRILIDTWRRGDRDDIRGVQAVIDVYEKVFRMNESERAAERSRLKEIFLQSLRVEKDDELSKLLVAAYNAAHGRPQQNPQSGNSGNATRGTRTRVGGDGFTGIHRMIRPRPLNINNSGYEPGYRVEYITFLPDGHVYWTLPPEGLLDFDPAVAQRAHPDDWGTYTIRNGEIRVLRGPQKLLYVLTRSGDRLNNPPSLGKGSFRHIPPADGLRIEGSYRRTDSEPAITFTVDGRFRDEGIFRNFGTAQRPDGTVYQDDGRGGSGTYTIEQYTLELRYSDGRVRRAPFIIFPENLAKKPAVDSFILRWEESMRRY